MYLQVNQPLPLPDKNLSRPMNTLLAAVLAKEPSGRPQDLEVFESQLRSALKKSNSAFGGLNRRQAGSAALLFACIAVLVFLLGGWQQLRLSEGVKKAASEQSPHKKSARDRLADIHNDIIGAHSRRITADLPDEKWEERIIPLNNLLETEHLTQPQRLVCLVLLGKAYGDGGKDDNAVKAWMDALNQAKRIETQPTVDVAEILYNLAESYRLAGHYNDAIKYARQSVRMFEDAKDCGYKYDLHIPEDLKCLPGKAIVDSDILLIAQSYLSLGNLSSADEWVQKALAEKLRVGGPGNTEGAITTLVELRELQGQKEEANRILDRFVDDVFAEARSGRFERVNVINGLCSFCFWCMRHGRQHKAAEIARKSLQLFKLEDFSKPGLQRYKMYFEVLLASGS